MKDQVIKHGTLQVSKDNVHVSVHVVTTAHNKWAKAVIQSFQTQNRAVELQYPGFILKGCADHGRPYSSVEYSQLPFVSASQEINWPLTTAALL